MSVMHKRGLSECHNWLVLVIRAWWLKSIDFFFFRCTWWTLRMCQSHVAPPPNSTPFQCSTSMTIPTSFWRSTKTWWCAPAAATDTDASEDTLQWFHQRWSTPKSQRWSEIPPLASGTRQSKRINAIKDLLLHVFLSSIPAVEPASF